jgi:hypothetical protein
VQKLGGANLAGDAAKFEADGHGSV